MVPASHGEAGCEVAVSALKKVVPPASQQKKNPLFKSSRNSSRPRLRIALQLAHTYFFFVVSNRSVVSNPGLGLNGTPAGNWSTLL